VGRTTVASLGCLVAFAIGGQTTLAASQSDPGAAIRHRLTAAHYPIYELSPANFQPPRPAQAFYTIVDYASQHAFELLVYVYPTRATATTALDRDIAHIEKYGIPGASKIGLAGRVEYLGTTGPLNKTGGMAPALPPKRFSYIVALAEGR
jgi:hypothetical protein